MLLDELAMQNPSNTFVLGADGFCRCDVGYSNFLAQKHVIKTPYRCNMGNEWADFKRHPSAEGGTMHDKPQSSSRP